MRCACKSICRPVWVREWVGSCFVDFGVHEGRHTRPPAAPTAPQRSPATARVCGNTTRAPEARPGAPRAPQALHQTGLQRPRSPSFPPVRGVFGLSTTQKVSRGLRGARFRRVGPGAGRIAGVGIGLTTQIWQKSTPRPETHNLALPNLLGSQ
jgi:hypothetical protein